MSLSATPTRLFNTSRDGASTASLGSLFQHQPFPDKILPDSKSKTPLAQPEAVALCTVSCHQRKQIHSLLATFFQVLVDSNKISPHSASFSQHYTTRSLSHSSQVLFSSSFTSFVVVLCIELFSEQLNVLLVVRGPKPNTVFDVWPHQIRVQGDKHFLALLATLFLMQARMPPKSFPDRWLSSHCSPGSLHGT